MSEDISPHESTINMDPAEISKFEALANRWWDTESEFKPLHAINPLRLNFIDEIAGLAGKKVLDVGCGGGILSESMALRGAHVQGIDLGEAPLNVAQLHSLESGAKVDYSKTSAEQLAAELESTPGAHFDVITCLEMLEHVPEPASVIEACNRMLKPGGHLFLSTINRNPKSYLFAIIGAEYVLNLLPKGTHDFAKFIKPSELASWLRDNHLDMQKIIGLTYNPITKIYKLSSDVDVNFMVHAQKPL